MEIEACSDASLLLTTTQIAPAQTAIVLGGARGFIIYRHYLLLLPRHYTVQIMKICNVEQEFSYYIVSLHSLVILGSHGCQVIAADANALPSNEALKFTLHHFY